jgi:hypothetical protein
MLVVPRRSFLIGVAMIGLGRAAFDGRAATAAAGGDPAQTPGPIPSSAARVWFLRQFEPGESLQMPMIFVNGAPLASSQPGTVFFRDFAAGPYAFSVETCTRDFNQVATLNLTAGSQTYLEVQSLSSFRNWDCVTDTFYVRAIPAERAQLYFPQLTYLGAG